MIRIRTLFPVLLLLLWLAPPGVLAQNDGRNIVTCEDGTRLLATPFRPNPCAKVQPVDPAKDIPDDFLLAFGLPPEPTQNSLRDRLARIEYQQALRTFRGLVDPPDGYFEKPRGQPTATVTIAEYYASWGLGEPVFYRDVYGSYIRWPSALYQPHRAPFSTGLLAPGVVVAQWQTEAVMAGRCVYDLQAFASASQPIAQRNRENCAAADSLGPPGVE